MTLPLPSRGERFFDARNKHNQYGKQSMDEVAKATGITKSLIQALEDDDQSRSVGYDKIITLAKHYGVSTDWLFGLTEDPHRKPCATDELGLSADVISIIIDLYAESTDATYGLNLLLSELDFWGVCKSVGELRKNFEAMSNEESLCIDIGFQKQIENEVITAHPELKNKIAVVYGDRMLSDKMKRIHSFFDLALTSATGSTDRTVSLYGKPKRGD